MAKSVEDFGTKVAFRRTEAIFLSFLFGFVIRLIPEVLSFPYPIGHDQIYYAWRIKSGVVWCHWSQVFSTWLLYAILIPLYNTVQLDPFVLLKLTAALLFGLNACGVYYFATKALGWTTKKGLLASVFFSLQIATLAFSSNFSRNMLSLGILLFGFTLIKEDFKGKRHFLGFMLLSVLMVFSHEHGSVILFAVVLWILLSRFLRGTKIDVLKLSMAVSPALALFLVSVYFFAFPVTDVVEKNVIWVDKSVGKYSGTLFFIKNYLAVYESVKYYPMYLNLASQVFTLFAGLYIVALPLVLVGFFRDDVLDGWTALLLVGSFGALVTPFFALDKWYRWMLMLVYPFTFYAVNGITKVLRWSRGSVDVTLRHVSWMKLADRAVKSILIIPFSLGLVFMATAMQGRAIPFRDVDDTIRAMRWLDAQMCDGSTLLTHDAFSHWARLYLDKRHSLILFRDDIEGAISAAMQHGFNNVYFVWWNEKIGWNSLEVPSSFVAIFSSGRISVYRYFG